MVSAVQETCCRSSNPHRPSPTSSQWVGLFSAESCCLLHTRTTELMFYQFQFWHIVLVKFLLQQILNYSQVSESGKHFMKRLSDVTIQSTLFVPENNGLPDNQVSPTAGSVDVYWSLGSFLNRTGPWKSGPDENLCEHSEETQWNKLVSVRHCISATFWTGVWKGWALRSFPVPTVAILLFQVLCH